MGPLIWQMTIQMDTPFAGLPIHLETRNHDSDALHGVLIDISQNHDVRNRKKRVGQKLVKLTKGPWLSGALGSQGPLVENQGPHRTKGP